MAAKGRISDIDRQWIIDNAGTLEPREMAEKLGKTEDTVRGIIRRFTKKQPLDKEERSFEQEVIKRLRVTPAYKQLKKQFTHDEIQYFEENYVQLVSQFRDDIAATEDKQIFQAITFEIYMIRNGTAKKKSEESIAKLEGARNALLKGKSKVQLDADDHSRLIMLEETIASHRNAIQASTGEYTKLFDCHKDLMKSLKGTRDQRIKQIENTKTTFLGTIKDLMKRDRQERESRELELVKMATAKEFERLSEPHKYGDGVLDRPILSAETVGESDD